MTTTAHSPDALISQVLLEGGQLSVSGDRLSCRGPRDVLDSPEAGALSSRKSEVISLLGDGKHTAASFAQQRLWFLGELLPDQEAYTLAALVHLSGALDIGALRRSLEEIIRRHEVLHTALTPLENVLAQVVAPVTPVDLPVAALPDVPPARRPAVLRDALAELVSAGFDPAHPPLLRMRLIDWGGNERALLIAAHHLVVDDWSMGVFAHELRDLYEAYSQGQPSPLAPLETQYADFAGWQRRRLRGDRLEEQLGYWRQQLAGMPNLSLPTDRGRAVSGHQRGESVPLQLSSALVQGLMKLAGGRDATLFMTLLAGFWAILGRYSGQQDFGVGTPIANRIRPELEKLIGFFANTLVLRADLSGDPSFAELIARARTTCLDAYDHQELPFERLVEELRPSRDLSQPPLFQAMLTLQNTPQRRFALPGAELTFEEVASTVARFDLELSFRAGDSGDLTGQLHYNSDLFERESVEWLAGALVRLLAEGLARPDRPVSELELLDEGARQRLLGQWARGPRTPLGGGWLHALVEQQADRCPQQTAITCGPDQIRYADLDQRSNQLAHHLHRYGIGPETRVAVCLDRTPDLIIALLAVLKAGGAYVPLDPAYPPGRLDHMLTDSGAQVLITTTSHQPGFTGHQLQLDTSAAAIAAEPASRPPTTVTAANLAYVIYTSGSTGHPKGVMITHGSAAALIGWAQHTFHPSELAQVLAATSICFDLSVFEIFAPLSTGGTVHLASTILQQADTGPSPCTLINTVPSAMTELIRLGTQLPAAQTINLAGEALPQRLVDDISAAPGLSQPRIINLYGPTEDTTYSTMAVVEPGATTPPPIGRPVGNTEAYILDTNLRPVLPGADGELFLGGSGLARGYLGQPALTADRFIPSPFATTPGARLYRTGDLCRFRADGTLAYLGRRDHQIKIRGFRVEPQEIETLLTSHPTITDALITSHDQQLHAYIVPTPHTHPDPTTLHTYLHHHLPAHLIPATITTLPAIPRTTNGKADRTHLPTPTPPPTTTGMYVPPANAVEEVVSGIVAEELSLERTGMADDFFELGGHSLAATAVVARLRQLFHVDLPLREMVAVPTSAGLTRALLRDTAQRARVERTAQLLVDLRPDDREEVRT
jgi:amino acid adenylation domain-containing protein